MYVDDHAFLHQISRQRSAKQRRNQKTNFADRLRFLLLLFLPSSSSKNAYSRMRSSYVLRSCAIHKHSIESITNKIHQRIPGALLTFAPLLGGQPSAGRPHVAAKPPPKNSWRKSPIKLENSPKTKTPVSSAQLSISQHTWLCWLRF